MWIGFFLILVAGVMNGSFATPMKHVRGWAWEHTWLLWSVTGLLLVPMAAFFATVAHPWEVYRVTDGRSLWMVVLFGLLWGISAILFGVGVARVGVAVGFALILGISSVLGSMIPLLSKRPEALLEPVGQLTAAGVLLQVVGVGLCGLASHKRARDGNAVLSKRRFWTGLLICFLSGLGAPMVNFGLVFGTKGLGGCRGARDAAGTRLERHLAPALRRRLARELRVLRLPDPARIELEGVRAAARAPQFHSWWDDGCALDGQ